MNKKEIKSQIDLNNIPNDNYEDEPEDNITSLDLFKQSLNNQINKESNNSISFNNKNDVNEEKYKELLIKELSENLNIDCVNTDTNTINNNELETKSLTTIQEVNSESKSNPSFVYINKEKQEEKYEENKEKIEDSIIPNTFNGENDLMSFYGGNNDIENIVKNLQYNEDMKQNISILIEDYLEVIHFNNISLEQIMKVVQTINPNDLQDCKNAMESLDYDGKVISKISDINFLLIKSQEIDNKEMDNIKKIIEEKENKLYAWRDILPGPDSFFRAIMFSFLEEIILSRNINMYRTFLFEFNKNLETNYFKRILAFYKIDSLRVKICLILIYYALTIQDFETSINKAHSLLIKIYNYDTNFDILLILNLKFLIYKYLKNNEKKLYTREYSIPVGSLLPSRYQKNKGNYNFKEFYENNLLQLNKEPEKITISLIPFILRRDLFIYSFEKNNINHIWAHTGNKENQEFIPFRLVIVNGSYEIVYPREYYNQFQKVFSNCSNISPNPIIKDNNKKIIVNENILGNIDDDENDKKLKESKNNYDNKDNNTINNTTVSTVNNNIDNNKNNQNNNYINQINEKDSDKINIYNSKNSNIILNNLNNNSNNNWNNNLNNNKTNIKNNNQLNIKNSVSINNVINNAINNNNNISNNLNNNIKIGNYMTNIKSNNNLENNCKIINNKNYNNNFKYNTINTCINNNINNNNINNNQRQIIQNQSKNIPNKELNNLEAFLESPLEQPNKININKTMRPPSSNLVKINSIKESNNIKNQTYLFANQECPMCKKPVKNNFYCQNCLLNHLIPFVQNSYIQFIKINISNIIKDKHKENLVAFLANLNVIFPNKTNKSFTEAYNLLNDNGKNIFNEKLKYFKSSLCLGCFKFINIGNNFVNNNEKGNDSKDMFLFKFPCGCVFCSEECLNRFINAVPINKIKTFVCGCGVEYEYLQLKFLLYFALSHNLIKFKNEILRYMYEIIKNKCCKCNKEIPLIQGKKNNVNIMEVIDKEAELIFGIYKFNHLICDKCIKDISKNKFYCNLCSSEHLITSKKNIKNCQIRNTCSIF